MRRPAQDKTDVLRRLRQEGKMVAMIGDAGGDAAASAQPDLGSPRGTGTDLTLVPGDLRVVRNAVRLARRLLAPVKGNLLRASAGKVAAPPPAAAGFLNPLLTGATAASSWVFDVANSLRLRRFQPLRRPSRGAATGPDAEAAPAPPEVTSP